MDMVPCVGESPGALSRQPLYGLSLVLLAKCPGTSLPSWRALGRNDAASGVSYAKCAYDACDGQPNEWAWWEDHSPIHPTPHHGFLTATSSLRISPSFGLRPCP